MMSSEELRQDWAKQRQKIKKETRGGMQDIEVALQQCDDKYAPMVDALRKKEEENEKTS